MSYMKQVYERIQELCELCGSRTKCNECKMVLKVNNHEGKQIKVYIKGGNIVEKVRK